MSHVSVFSITEDSDGFLWFGTRDGLNKYDGYDFTVYKKGIEERSIVGNDIRTLYQDPSNNQLWVGTLEGLSIYNKSTNSFHSYRNNEVDSTTLSSNHIGAFLRTSKGEMLIGTSMGLNRYNETSLNFTRYSLSSSVGGNSIEAIFEDSNGRLWIGTREGLFEVQLNEGKFYANRMDVTIGLSGEQIMDIAEDKSGGLWIGTADGGLNYLPKGENRVLSFKHNEKDSKSLSHNSVRDICIDHKNQVWVGTFDGLNKFNPTTSNFSIYRKDVNIESNFPDNSIKAIYEDQRGSLWVGTYYGGIINIDETFNQFQNFAYSPYQGGLNGEVISSFAEDERGNLWIGIEGGGLNYYDISSREYISLTHSDENENSISGNNVKQLLLSGDSLWIGTFNAGYNILNLKSKNITRYKSEAENENSISNNNIYGFLKTGKYMWMVTYGGGLNIYNLESKKYHHYVFDPRNTRGINSDFLRSIYQSASGDIWIGTSVGLNKVILNHEGLPQEFEHYLKNERIYSIAEDETGNLFIGTISNGLFVFDPVAHTHQRFSEKDGLSGDRVYGILQDNDHYFWISTNNGLSRFDVKNSTFRNFNESNGLQSTEFNYNGYYKCRNGDLLFGGIDGYTRFNPKLIYSNEYVPPIAFTKISRNNVELTTGSGDLSKSLNELNEITFKHNEANFTIGFAALDFFSPQNNKYAFKLEGLDRDWNYTIGEPTATYTIQNSGEYLFRLKGSNSDGYWNPEEKQIVISVLPPPWKSWWAYLIYFCLLCAAVYSVVRFLRLRTSLKLEKLAKRQQDEMHQMKLRFFTNITHEFRTPLTLILGPIEELMQTFSQNRNHVYEKRLKIIHSNANRLLNLVNQLMTFRKMETGHEKLEVDKILLLDFATEVYSLFKEKAIQQNINYNLHVANKELYIWGDREKLEKVLSNLLSNAFKFTSPGGNINLEIQELETEIILSVSDNGSGISKKRHSEIFQRFYEKNTNTSHNLIKGSGVGLALSKEIIEQHKGYIEVISSEDEGAQFNIILRKGREHYEDNNVHIKSANTKLEDFSRPTPLERIENYSNRLEEDKNHKLLIVDDNLEILEYLRTILDQDFIIITASNGLEGLEKVHSYKPEIIISDYMMPMMDGISFCNAIKENFETSHIPFILLTAKAELGDKLLGLHSGANDYISKPFHPEELKLKVTNIIYQRQRFKKSIGENRTFSPSEVNLTSADEEFLKAFMELVEENIGNSEFKIDQISHELAISRALLFNKIKSLTEMTPKSFIKSFRMKRAAQLLESGSISISEVAYQVGFKEPKYFSRVFHREFGTSPSEYISRMTAT